MFTTLAKFSTTISDVVDNVFKERRNKRMTKLVICLYIRVHVDLEKRLVSSDLAAVEFFKKTFPM